MSPIHAAQQLGQAFALLDSGQLAEARRLARALEKLRPEPPGLAYLLGLVALAEGDGRKAAQHLQRARRATPDAVPPLLAMARAQSLQQRHVEAGHSYRLLLVVAPDLAIGWQESCAPSLAAGHWAEARAPLTRAARLSPAQSQLLNNLGIAARADHDQALAQHAWRAAIALDPAAAKPYANLAGLRRHLRQTSVPLAGRAILLQGDGAAEIEFGQALLEHGDDLAALAAFQRAAPLLPNHVEPLWLQAVTLDRLGRATDAAALCRAIIAMDPDDPFGARLLLTRLSGEAAPDRASVQHISRLYDQYASSFEDNLLGDLDYRAPAILLEALRRCGLAGPFAVLDVGCGTGLMGQAIRSSARRLDGIDLSARMIERARLRGIYDDLAVGDLVTDLARRRDYDLILAADVLIYFGDLTELAGLVARTLRPSGVFAFTVEESRDQDVHLQPNGRFAHSERHLRQVAAAAHFSVTLLEQTSTRRESDHPVPGLVCILTRS